MIQIIKNILGIGPKADFKELVKNGAQIIDVRSTGEYKGGHLKNSINMPLDSLQRTMTSLKKDKPVITCCASGMRSASAKNILKANGFIDVHNGGGWASLKNKLQ